MAFSETLAERIRQQLTRRTNIEEKKMFGGVGFLLNGNLLVGVWKDSLVVRIGPDAYGRVTLPPEATRVCPVVKLDRSLNRKQASSAISSGRPRRPIGVSCLMEAICSSVSTLAISVSI